MPDARIESQPLRRAFYCWDRWIALNERGCGTIGTAETGFALA
jgi:hypothetical protein